MRSSRKRLPHGNRLRMPFLVSWVNRSMGVCATKQHAPLQSVQSTGARTKRKQQENCNPTTLARCNTPNRVAGFVLTSVSGLKLGHVIRKALGQQHFGAYVTDDTFLTKTYSV
jgi:hypothetical protein